MSLPTKRRAAVCLSANSRAAVYTYLLSLPKKRRAAVCLSSSNSIGLQCTFLLSSPTIRRAALSLPNNSRAAVYDIAVVAYKKKGCSVLVVHQQ
jgi:hypothetical protein